MDALEDPLSAEAIDDALYYLDGDSPSSAAVIRALVAENQQLRIVIDTMTVLLRAKGLPDD